MVDYVHRSLLEKNSLKIPQDELKFAQKTSNNSNNNSENGMILTIPHYLKTESKLEDEALNSLSVTQKKKLLMGTLNFEKNKNSNLMMKIPKRKIQK